MDKIKSKKNDEIIIESDSYAGSNVNWDNFIIGEAELKCETIEDAELLMKVCKENNICCNYITAEQFRHEPYWYVKDGRIETTKYVLDDDNICSFWTVQRFIEEHIL